jgi:hypothetical protein
MTQKLLCLGAVCALLFVFATANVANAENAAPAAAAPCAYACAMPCQANPCFYPPVAYRVGLFGHIRPVVYAPVVRPVYVAPRFAYPAYVPYRACPPYYAW